MKKITVLVCVLFLSIFTSCGNANSGGVLPGENDNGGGNEGHCKKVQTAKGFQDVRGTLVLEPTWRSQRVFVNTERFPLLQARAGSWSPVEVVCLPVTLVSFQFWVQTPRQLGFPELKIRVGERVVGVVSFQQEIQVWGSPDALRLFRWQGEVPLEEPYSLIDLYLESSAGLVAGDMVHVSLDYPIEYKVVGDTETVSLTAGLAGLREAVETTMVDFTPR